jgi:hypothetical protein
MKPNKYVILSPEGSEESLKSRIYNQLFRDFSPVNGSK